MKFDEILIFYLVVTTIIFIYTLEDFNNYVYTPKEISKLNNFNICIGYIICILSIIINPLSYLLYLCYKNRKIKKKKDTIVYDYDNNLYYELKQKQKKRGKND